MKSGGFHVKSKDLLQGIVTYVSFVIVLSFWIFLPSEQNLALSKTIIGELNLDTETQNAHSMKPEFHCWINMQSQTDKNYNRYR